MPVRIQLSRTAGWRIPQGAIRADRATIYGNPWVAARPRGALTIPSMTGAAIWIARHEFQGPLLSADAAAIYSRWLRDGTLHLPPALHPIANEEAVQALAARRLLILAHLHQLHGRQLACWCPPGSPCHADALMEIANA